MQKVRRYDLNLPFHHSYVNIQIYTKDIALSRKVLQKLEDLYSSYNKLIIRRESSEKGVFYIENNDVKDETLKISPFLYEVLERGKEFEEKSDKISLSLFPITSLWENCLQKKQIPEKIDLEKKMQDIHTLELLGNDTISNNHVSLQLDGIIDGFVTEKAVDLLNKYGISMYLINTDGVIVSGKSYLDLHKVALQDTVSSSYYGFIRMENKVLATKSVENPFLEDGVLYHTRINPSTFYPSSYHRGVSVLASSAMKADLLSLILFHMSIEDGKKYIENEDVEVLWYSVDSKVTYTDGMKKYMYYEE